MQRGSATLSEDVPRDTGAFERLYRENSLAVRRHLVDLLGDKQAAEDLTQETFSRLYTSGSADGEELRNPRAWLLAVASNLAYNHLRGEGRRTARERIVDASPATDLDEVLDVRRALEALAPRDRIVLMLRHSGFSYAEIAEAVDLAPGSVGTILARSQRRFREAYEGVRPDAEGKE